MTFRIKSIRSLAFTNVVVCFVLLTQVGCDSQRAMTGKELIPTEGITIDNGYLSVRVSNAGYIHSGRLVPDETEPNLKIPFINAYGLWMAGSQDGISANTGVRHLSINAYKFDESAMENAGLYLVNHDDIDEGINNWPVDFGAPTNVDGSPKMYGDVMAWALYEPASEPYPSPNSFSGIVIGQTVFTFEREPLRQVVFVRYDISNTSNKKVTDLHLGFGGDGDLYWANGTERPCGGLNGNHNQVGYDHVKHYSYTYIKPDAADGNLASGCYGAMAGFSILDMQSANGLSQAKLAHRMVNRWPEEPFVEFTETEIQTPEHVLLALQGLSSTGAPMIDPTTGQPTTFAFTGDPVSETGWLDIRKDVRSLQSISPFDLLPGETKTMTVAVFTTMSSSFTNGIQDLRKNFDAIMRMREEWDY